MDMKHRGGRYLPHQSMPKRPRRDGLTDPQWGNSGFQGHGSGRSHLPYRVQEEGRHGVVHDVPYKEMHSEQPQMTANVLSQITTKSSLRELVQDRIAERIKASESLIQSLTVLKDVFDTPDLPSQNSGFNMSRDTHRHTARQGAHRDVDPGWGQADPGWGQGDPRWGHGEQESEERAPYWKGVRGRAHMNRIDSRRRGGESQWNEGDPRWNRGDLHSQGCNPHRGQRFGRGAGFQWRGIPRGRFGGSNFGSRGQGAYRPPQPFGHEGPVRFGGPRGLQAPCGPRAAFFEVPGRLKIKEGPPGHHMGPTKYVCPSELEKKNSLKGKVPSKTAFENLTKRLRSFGASGSITTTEFESLVQEEDVGLWRALVIKRVKKEDDGEWEHTCDLYLRNIYISTGRKRERNDVKKDAYNEALKVFLSKSPDTIIGETPKMYFNEMKKKADSVETPYMIFDSNYGTMMLKRENDDPLPLSDFIILEPEDATEKAGLSATDILRQSADFSKMVLSFEIKSGPGNGWTCTVLLENQVLCENIERTRPLARKVASDVILKKLQQTNYTFLLKNLDGRKMVPVVQDIIAEFGRPALETEEGRQEYQDKLCDCFKKHFGESEQTELAIPMKNMTLTEKVNIVGAAKTCLLVAEERVRAGNDDDGMPLYQKREKGDRLVSSNQFLIVSRRPQGKEVLELLKKYGENAHYKLKYPLNMEQTKEGNKPKKGPKLKEGQKDGDGKCKDIHGEGDGEDKEGPEEGPKLKDGQKDGEGKCEDIHGEGDNKDKENGEGSMITKSSSL